MNDYWKQKACPFLSVATIAEAPSPVLSGGSGKRAASHTEKSFQACIGPNCMLFVPLIDAETKEITDGACGVPMISTGLNMLGSQLTVALAQLAVALRPPSTPPSKPLET